MPFFTDSLYNQGLEAARAGRLAEARDRLTTAVTLAPTDADAWMVLGKVHAQRDDLATARDCWREALRLAPGRADAQAALARADAIERARTGRARMTRALAGCGLVAALLLGYTRGAWHSTVPAEAAARASTVASEVAVARSAAPSVAATQGATSAASPVAPSIAPTPGAPSPTPAVGAAPSPTNADAALPRALARVLAADPRRRFEHVEVQTGMHPTLSGTVNTDDDRADALRLARAVLGAAPADRLATRSLACYTVQRGDTLWTVAARYYGDGEQWPRIARANPHLPADPALTPEGTVLIIPRRFGP